jgi:catechol 2,3-dioxygenase
MTSTPPYGIPAPRYRLPDATRVGRVRLQVADLHRSVAFYTRVLGLQLVHSTDALAALGATGAGQPLVELHERPGARPVPRRGLLGLFHFALLLPDRAALGRFVRHLADSQAYFGSADHSVSEAVYLTDPDGLGIELYADRPRRDWRTAGRELRMTTETLDLRDLMHAAGDAPWTGLPAGTAMGHVHLFVGALDKAAAFYHEALGFDKVVWSYPGALFLSAGGYHHHLGTNVWAAGAPPATADDARLLDWELIVPDPDAVEQVARHVAEAGYTVTTDGGTRLIADPWGTAVRVLPEPATNGPKPRA